MSSARMGIKIPAFLKSLNERTSLNPLFINILGIRKICFLDSGRKNTRILQRTSFTLARSALHKDRKAVELVYYPDRVKHLMKKTNGIWERIRGDKTLREIAEKLQQLRRKFDPEVPSILSGSIGVENIETMETAQLSRTHYGVPPDENSTLLDPKGIRLETTICIFLSC